MDRSWTQSPEWQRVLELQEELERARDVMHGTGSGVLSCLRTKGLDTMLGRQACEDYLLASQTCDDAFARWHMAGRAFKASPAGKAYARRPKNPVAAVTEREVA